MKEDTEHSARQQVTNWCCMSLRDHVKYLPCPPMQEVRRGENRWAAGAALSKHFQITVMKFGMFIKMPVGFISIRSRVIISKTQSGVMESVPAWR